MKKMILFIGLIFAMPGAASAMIDVVNVEYTGNKAGLSDRGYQPGNFASYMGGPLGNNSFGGAFEFTNESEVQINTILLTALGRDDVPGRLEESDFKFKVYRGSLFFQGTNSVIPNWNNMVAESPVYLTDNVNQSKQYVDYQVPFNATLAPDRYWLAREREGDSRNMIVTDIDTKFARVHNPEPVTALLFGGGLLGAWRMRKRGAA